MEIKLSAQGLLWDPFFFLSVADLQLEFITFETCTGGSIHYRFTKEPKSQGIQLSSGTVPPLAKKPHCTSFLCSIVSQ